MAKFNIEVELDWLYEDENIDERIKKEVISGLQNTITHNVKKAIEEKMEERINEEVEKVVDVFLKKVTVESLETMTFPYKEDSWSSEVKHVSMSQYLGKKFEEFLTEKTLTKNGGKPDWNRDAVYSVADYLTKGYIAEELNEKVIDMIQKSKTQAEETLIKNLEQNLQLQLNADMLRRLNIPALLENLQNTIEHIDVDGDNK